MNVSQAIEYLEVIAVNRIQVREMSKALFKFMRSAARAANREWPGMAGYYDPEYEGPRAIPAEFLFPKAHYGDTFPQSDVLKERFNRRLQDPFESVFDLIMS